MNRFGTAREAKEYLIGRILAQASQDGVALSDVERKMLYFSETGWTPPGMKAASDEFDQSCNEEEYEAKVGAIVRHILDQPGGDRDAWDDAAIRLSEEDHYLSVLIDGATLAPGSKRPRSILKVILAAALSIALYFPIAFYVYAHVGNEELAKWINGGAFAAVILLVAWAANRGER